MSLFFALFSAHAYDFSGSDWSWQDRPLARPVYLHVEAFPAWIGTADEIEAAVVQGLELWNDVARVEVYYGGRTTEGFAQHDGRIVIDYHEEGGGPLGMTIQSGNELGAKECDIWVYGHINGGPFNYQLDPDSSGRHLALTVGHEVGHCLGLGHSDEPDALMYAYQTNTPYLPPLHDDDIAGLRALYGNCTDDSDGDGFLDCNGDCDDSEPARANSFPEVCDGIDNDCDGEIDEIGTLSFDYGSEEHVQDRSGWMTFNAYRVDEVQMLEQFSVRAEPTEAGLVSWFVYEQPDGATQASRLASPTLEVTPGGDWWTSPRLNLELRPGNTYFIGFGGENQVLYPRGYRPAAAGEPVELVGHSLKIWRRDRTTVPLTNYQDYAYLQQLEITPLADRDGDGLTGACGDCDEGTAPIDTDGDGVEDCVDPCPDEAGDPDNDGICAFLDTCPDTYDPQQLDNDGDGLGNACDSTPNGPPPPPTPPNPTPDSGSGSCALGCQNSSLYEWAGLLRR